jgi:uncharacterized protein RhaS with RHS repeats
MDGMFNNEKWCVVVEEKRQAGDLLLTRRRLEPTPNGVTWDMELDVYGKVRNFVGSSLSDCPFRYQGQYQDEETGLYYNQFRYYDVGIGGYKHTY